MSDLDPSTAGTGRLRRRSFYETMEADPSSSSTTMDTISLHDTADASASSSTSIALGGHDASSSSSPLLSAEGAASGTGSSAGGSGGGSSSRGLVALGRSLLQLLVASVWYVKAWCIVKWQALEVRARLARTLRRGGSLGGADGSSTTETLVVKQYAYPTHWIKLACVSLVLFQWTIYAHWQHTPLALHVDECVFDERMLPALPARERILAGGGEGGGGGGGGPLPGGAAPLGGAVPLAKAAANLAAVRFLERRFELLQAPALHAHHNSNPRLPWTCIAIVPTLKTTSGGEGGGEDAEEPNVAPLLQSEAKHLSLLLPRSQIVSPQETSGISSRVHLALASGSQPVVATREPTSGGSVLAAMFPLAAFRPSLFPKGFPDLVLVKTEYALKKLVLYRHERQEEFQHRIDRRHDGDGEAVPRGGANDERLRQEKSKTQFGVYLLKTTVPDIYDRHVRKNWNAFLHVVVVGEQDKKKQLTKEILLLWLHHPEWPMLFVRFQQSLSLCQSFVRMLTTMRQVTGDDAEIVDDHDKQALPRNLNISCEPQHNTRNEIVHLKNSVGLHLFPVPPEMEVYEDLVLESAAAGALVVTYNTPIMHEWVTDACGIRVGSYENAFPSAGPKGESGEPGDLGLLELPVVRVTSGEIERAVEGLLKLDRVHRVAAGRAARVRYLAIRTHFLSAVAALDTAICDSDSDDALELQNEIGQRSRKKVDVATLRVFLY
jgi:hypothetical protein